MAPSIRRSDQPTGGGVTRPQRHTSWSTGAGPGTRLPGYAGPRQVPRIAERPSVGPHPYAGLVDSEGSFAPHHGDS